jgi:pimeloyl-ACP methyl ester carboxylesterase
LPLATAFDFSLYVVQVWASGFAAALLGKRSSAVRYDDLVPGKVVAQPAGLPDPLQQRQTHATMREAFLHSALEKFFSIFLQLPLIRKRLAEVTTILAEKQPASPQLYIYSTADKVIPVRYVESFIEKQKQQGRSVWSKNMEHSPHVDHFRANPAEYTQHLREFLEKCVPHVDGKKQGGHTEAAPVAEV